MRISKHLRRKRQIHSLIRRWMNQLGTDIQVPYSFTNELFCVVQAQARGKPHVKLGRCRIKANNKRKK